MALTFFIVAILATVIVGYLASSKVAKVYQMEDYEYHKTVTGVVGLSIVFGMFAFALVAKGGTPLDYILAVLACVAISLGLSALCWLTCFVEEKFRKE